MSGEASLPLLFVGVDGVGGWLLLIIMLGLPLAFSALGIWIIRQELRFARVAIEVEGEVLSVEARRSDRRTVYRPTFSFTLPDGRTLQAPTHGRSSGYGYSKGRRLAILVDPDQPKVVRMADAGDRYLVGGVFAALGLFVFGMFLYGLHMVQQAPPVDKVL